MSIPRPPFSSSDFPNNYFSGGRRLTEELNWPGVAQVLRDIFDRFISLELASSGTALPGNDEGYGVGFVFTLTGGAVRDPARFVNNGTSAVVDWQVVPAYWQQAANPNVAVTQGYAGDGVRDTAGGTNYQQRTAPSGNTWDAI